MAASPNHPTPTPAGNVPAPSRVFDVVAIATANVPIIAAAAVNLTRELLTERGPRRSILIRSENGALRRLVPLSGAWRRNAARRHAEFVCPLAASTTPKCSARGRTISTRQRTQPNTVSLSTRLARSCYIQRYIPPPGANGHTRTVERPQAAQRPACLWRALRTLPAILYCALMAGTLVGSAPHAFACNGNGNCENAPGHNKEYSGAPGPIAGAGTASVSYRLRCLLAD